MAGIKICVASSHYKRKKKEKKKKKKGKMWLAYMFGQRSTKNKIKLTKALTYPVILLFYCPKKTKKTKVFKKRNRTEGRG